MGFSVYMKDALQFILGESREQIGSQAKQYRTSIVPKLEPNFTAPAVMCVSWRSYQVACSFNEVITPGNKYVRFSNKTSASV